jgi:solute carrier family 25 carnitine/acylcarnitine transporter 20/29
MTATTTPPLHDVLAGGVAGSAGIIIGHPLDSMKVRLQTAASSSSCAASSFSSSSPIMMMLARQGGRHHSQHALQQQQQWVGKHTRSLWAGIGPPLVMASLVNASVFVTYGTTTRLWDEYNNDSNSQSSILATSSSSSSLTRNAVCGGIAGIVSSIIVCPVDLVKTKLQTASRCSSSSSSFSSYQTTKEIYTNYGIRGLYRGLLTTIYRQFPSFIIYFGSYDVIKTTLLQQQQLQYQNLLASIIAGGIAGSLSWAIIYPIDLIKTRIQSLSPTTVSVTLNSLSGGGAATSYYHIMKNEHIMIQSITSSIINQHGWKALYSGFGITILRAFPMNAVIFPTYELTLATLQHIL